MEKLSLANIDIGKVDAKYEFLDSGEGGQAFLDRFTIPENLNVDAFDSGSIYFVKGLRGTGKTTFLRWNAEKRKLRGECAHFVLFKSDLSESAKMKISAQAGWSFDEFDPAKSEISQDFKEAWVWFLHHKIGQLFVQYPDLYVSDEHSAAYLKILGLDGEGAFAKVLGYFPKLDGVKIKLKASIPFFEAELEGDIDTLNSTTSEVTLDALNTALWKRLEFIQTSKKISLFFDELEVFYHTKDQYMRDVRMVRDIIFTVDRFNDFFIRLGKNIRCFAAVRSEVLDAMSGVGQEVERLVHDRGVNISWNSAKRSLSHPLLQMIAKKIAASEKENGIPISDNLLEKYFPKNIGSDNIDAYLLDNSFYRPRDLIWRLTIAQKAYPNDGMFSTENLTRTAAEYSAKLWEEIRYELSASYSQSDVDVITMAFSGAKSYFHLADMEERFTRVSRDSERCRALLKKRSVEEILRDLFRLGAVGNDFRASTHGERRNRWVFRGDATLLIDKQMVINKALWKHLSTTK